jgi:hypothetical protein
MTVISIEELKARKEARMQKALDDLFGECAEIDKEAYAYAAAQALHIEAAIVESDAPVIKIQIGMNWYDLPIIHMDVLNEVYTMLENLKKLGEEPESVSNMLEDWFVINRDGLVELNDYKDIEDNEYIDNIFELAMTKGLYDVDTPYVLSRLLLARDNVADDNVDCITMLESMVVSISYIMAQLFDK